MDKRAEFEVIVRQETNRVFGVAYRLCGNYHQASDITQETFFRAYRSFHRFEGRAKISTYLYRIACNVWKNTLRKKRVQNFTSYSAGIDAAKMEDFAEPGTLSPSEELCRADKSRIVQECIDSLLPAEKAVIVLRDIEDRSYEEIAQILNCRTGTVKSRLARARQKLAEKIAPLREELQK